MGRVIKLSKIKISPSFAETVPKEEKMEECRRNYKKYGRQDRYIVIDHTNTLIDGYIMYLVLKENNVEEAKIKVSDRRKKRWERINTKGWIAPHYRAEMTTYVYGVHPNSKYAKEFVWRVPKAWTGFGGKVEVGDTVFCDTKFGVSPVVVTKVEMLDKCPIDIPVKRVTSKETRRNGMVVN